MTIAGALTEPGNSPLRPNLFTALVGAPHSGKSACTDLAFYLMNARQAGIVVETRAGSAEGLLASLSERTMPVLLSLDELAHLLAKSQIENASFPSTLTSLFYGDHMSLRVARGKEVNFNARLSILGNVVEENFGDAFGASSMFGLYDRFIFGLQPRDYVCEYRPPDGKPWFELDKDRPVMPAVNPDVWEWKDQLVKNGTSPRVVEISLRVAGICAAFDGRKELKATDLYPASEFAREQEEARRFLRPNEGQNQDARVRNKILRFLEREGGVGACVTKREMLRCTHVGAAYGLDLVDRVLRAMERCGEIQQETRETGGRPCHMLRKIARLDEEG